MPLSCNISKFLTKFKQILINENKSNFLSNNFNKVFKPNPVNSILKINYFHYKLHQKVEENCQGNEPFAIYISQILYNQNIFYQFFYYNFEYITNILT